VIIDKFNHQKLCNPPKGKPQQTGGLHLPELLRDCCSLFVHF
jgi:hypothetical protein